MTFHAPPLAPSYCSTLIRTASAAMVSWYTPTKFLVPSQSNDCDSSHYELRLFCGVKLNRFFPYNFAIAIKCVAEKLHAKEAMRILVQNGWMIAPVAELIFKQYLIEYTLAEKDKPSLDKYLTDLYLRDKWPDLENCFQQDIESINCYLSSQNTGLHLVITRSHRNQWDFMATLHLVYPFQPDPDGDIYLSLDALSQIDTSRFQSIVSEFVDVSIHIFPKVYSCIHAE